MKQEEFADIIYEIVGEIPEGTVATYGLIAKLAGSPRHARLVGSILKYAFREDIPCHRVIHSDGRLVAGWSEQRALLEEEGISFHNGKVDLKKCLWKRNNR